MADELKLHGTWASPFSYRAIWALKLKGVPFEYIEEDLTNKSSSLLKYNPVHKKIPVLVHGGKPICESMVILEYIDETWPENALLPRDDPYKRAVTHFWIKFGEDKAVAVWKIFRSFGEELEKARKEALEMLETVEEHGIGDNKFFHGEKIGILDIQFGSIAYWLEIIEEVTGVKLLESKKFPRLHKWNENFKQVPIIKENLPNREEILAFFKGRREQLEASS